MAEENQKSLIESLLSVCIDGSKSMADDFPKWSRPIARIILFCLILLSSIILAPIVLVLEPFRKSTMDPFYKLRTELETKWYGAGRDKALSELRAVKETLSENDDKLFFQGVLVPPYGKFKFKEFTEVLWLLYHWEFHSGNFQEASELCDYIIEKGAPRDSSENTPNTYWEEWVLNKAKAIYKKDGATATQQYLLKFVDPKKEKCRINEYLYELREESKKSV